MNRLLALSLLSLFVASAAFAQEVRTSTTSERIGVSEPEITPPPTLTFDQRIEDAGAALGVYTRISSVIPRGSELAPVSSLGAIVRFELGVEYAPVSPVDGLALEVGLAAGAQSRAIFESGTALLGLTSLHLSAVYRVPIWTYFGAYARGTGGIDWGHLSIREALGDTELDDVALGFSGAAVLGTELTVPVGYTRIGTLEAADQWLGFYVELGYAFHSSLAFDELRRDTDDDTEPARIPRTAVDAGGVDLSGVVWRIGASFRF